MIKALELTPSSWLLSKKSGKHGLMRKENDNYIVIGGPFVGTYKNIKQLEKVIGSKIVFEKLMDDNSEKAMIENYPVKHSTVYDIKLGEYPIYTKREGSKDRYAAGYYTIEFTNNFQLRFCPRVSTLESNDWDGPFKTKLEAMHDVKIKNGKE